MNNSKFVFKLKEWALKKPIRQPCNNNGDRCDKAVYQNDVHAPWHLQIRFTIQSGKDENQYWMNDINAIRYLANEIAIFVFEVDNRTIKLA